MNFFKSSIMVVTLSSLMWLNVEAIYKVIFRIPGERYNVKDHDHLTFVKKIAWFDEPCFVDHPNFPGLGLHLWYSSERQELHLKNNKGGTILYKIYDPTQKMCTLETEITPGAEHKVKAKKAEIWFTNYNED